MRNNIWRYNFNQHSDIYAKKHPCPFPLQLARDLIISWSNENDLVLDPFSGVGTTCLAAKQLNRKFIGIEISKQYCKWASLRLQYHQNLSIIKEQSYERNQILA